MSALYTFQTLTDVSECLSLQPLAGSQYPYNYAPGQMGYWNPQGYPAQVQGQQFLGMQGFTYGQYGYQQGYVFLDKVKKNIRVLTMVLFTALLE